MIHPWDDRDLLGEVAVEVESTTDGLQGGETVDVLQSGVVGHLETASNGLQLGEGDVGHVLVADEREGAADGGEVGGREALEEVGVEAHGAVEGGERGDADLGAVAEGHVEGPLEVGEDGGDVAAVGLEDQRRADVAELHGDVVEVVVVGDGHLVDGLEVDAVEGVELGVLDGDGAGLLHAGGERETLQGRERGPVERLHVGEAGEVEGGEDGQAVEGEGVVDRLQAVGGKLGDLGHVVRDQASLYSPHPVDGDGVGGAGRDGDAAGEGGARGQGGGVTGVLDGGGGGTALGWAVFG